MALGPVVSGARLSKHKVVWPEDLAIRTRPDRVHGAGLEINENSPGDVLASGGFVVVDIDALEL